MATLKTLEKQLPARIPDGRDQACFGLETAPGSGKYTRHLQAPCYYEMFRAVTVQKRAGILYPAQTKAPPYSIQLLQNVLGAYQAHGFFPEGSTFIQSPVNSGLAVNIPGGTHILKLKLAAFTYRYIETQYPKDMLLIYRQWLAQKRAGVTFWQCFHWLMAHRGHYAGHGIFSFNAELRYSPVLSLVFAQLCSTPESKLPAQNYMDLVGKISTMCAQYLQNGRIPTLPLKSLLSRRLGQLLQKPLEVTPAQLDEVLKTFKTLKLTAKAPYARYY